MMTMTPAELLWRVSMWLVPRRFERLRVSLSIWLTQWCPTSSYECGHRFAVRGYLSPVARRCRCVDCGENVRQCLLNSGKGRAFGWYHNAGLPRECDAASADNRYAANKVRPMAFDGMVQPLW